MIHEETISKWEDIHSLTLKHKGWIYRGQRDSTWPLQTSFERLCERTPIALDERTYVENALLRDFRRSYHHYGHDGPDKTSNIEWLSIMQHYGAPTRLIDFSYSMYVAAYFAIEDAHTKAGNSHATVWAVDHSWVLKSSAVLLEKHGKPNARMILDYSDESCEDIYQDFFFKKPFANLAVCINPFRLNERLRIQRGVFMCPGNIECSFMDNLASMPDYEDHVMKIHIPERLRLETLHNLNDMNISRTNLFPGLDGFAQSLGRFHICFTGKPDWLTP